MFTFILLVLVVVFAIELSKSQDEVKKLRKELSEFKFKEQHNNETITNNSITKTAEPNKETIYEEIPRLVPNNNTQPVKPEPQQNKQQPQQVQQRPQPVVRKVNSEQTKNTLILIAGAVLIVLAAIVFLTSTWNTIPNVIKTGTLILLVGVFLGASYLAEKKLKLDLTSKTFYYIAMAYIPIVIFSISIFELFGTYLSIFGEGRYLYFAFSWILLAAFYFAEAIRKKRRSLVVCSFITQVVAIINIILIFSTNFYSIIMGMLCYLLVMYIVLRNIKNIDFGLAVRKTLFVIQIVVSVITLIATLYHWLIEECNLIDIINMMLLTSTYCVKQTKKDGIKYITGMGTLLILLTVLNLKYFTIDGEIKLFIMVFSSNILYLFNYLIIPGVNENAKHVIIIKNIAFVIHVIIFAVGLIATCNNWVTANCGVLDIINIILAASICYMFQRKNGGAKIILDISLLMIILTIISLKYFTISGDIKFLIMVVSANAIYLYNYITTHELIHKIISYILFNFVLLSLVMVFDIIGFVKYIPFITTSIVLLIEALDRSEQIKYYLMISFAFTFLMLNTRLNMLTFTCLLIAIIEFVLYLKRENMNNWFMAFPIVAIMPSLYMPGIDFLKQCHLNMILSFILIALTTGKSILDKRIDSVYLYASILYIISSIMTFEMNMYVNLLIVLLWAVLHAETYKQADFFKVVAYITGLALYNYFLFDIQFKELNIVNCAGYLICLYLITRTVLKKYGTGYKAIEYIGTSIIFIYALNTYLDIVDAMIFIFALVCFVVFGYIKKVGPLFLTSLIAIVINVFRLTKDFWYSIPWWVYMLFVGSALIIFATRNEINEKNGRITVKEIVKKLKDNVDI